MTEDEAKKESERACLLLAVLPPEVMERVAGHLGPADRSELERVSGRLVLQPVWRRRRRLLEALCSSALAPILARGESRRLDRLEPDLSLEERRETLRERILDRLDPRIWFYARRHPHPQRNR